MTSWQVITDLNVDRVTIRKLLASYGLFPLQPNTVLRKEIRNGLMCYRDEELCWVCAGLEEIPEALRKEPLVNDVLESPKATLA